MEELIKILNMNDYDIEQYVENRIAVLNSLHNNVEEVSLTDGEIYPGWINTEVSYWPSGNRSKGFKLTKQFYIDFCKNIKQTFKNFDINVVKSKFNSDRLMQWINLYLSSYFGETCNDTLRKEIFGYGALNSIGETLSVEMLKGKNVARCSEKSGGLNGLANFMGIDCSLILSEATFENITAGHAYCLINQNGKYKIYDPNFFGVNSTGNRVPFIFDFDIKNANKKSTFNLSELGAINSTDIKYHFPWCKLNIIEKSSSGKKITINSNDIAYVDKEEALSTSDIEEKKVFLNRLLDKFKGKGEK